MNYENLQIIEINNQNTLVGLTVIVQVMYTNNEPILYIIFFHKKIPFLELYQSTKLVDFDLKEKFEFSRF